MSLRITRGASFTPVVDVVGNDVPDRPERAMDTNLCELIGAVSVGSVPKRVEPPRFHVPA